MPLALLADLSDEEEEQPRHSKLEYKMPDRDEHLDHCLRDRTFRNCYRLDYDSFMAPVDILEPLLESKDDPSSESVRIEMQLAMTIRWLVGSAIIDLMMIWGVSESTGYAIVNRVINAVNNSEEVERDWLAVRDAVSDDDESEEESRPRKRGKTSSSKKAEAGGAGAQGSGPHNGSTTENSANDTSCAASDLISLVCKDVNSLVATKVPTLQGFANEMRCLLDKVDPASNATVVAEVRAAYKEIRARTKVELRKQIETTTTFETNNSNMYACDFPAY